jgi:hypothetical protein
MLVCWYAGMLVCTRRRQLKPSPQECSFKIVTGSTVIMTNITSTPVRNSLFVLLEVAS